MIDYRKVFVGSSCNNNCKYCKYQNEQRQWKNIDEVKARLEEKRSRAGESADHDSVELLGGEPAIRNDLMDIVTYARNWGWRRIKMRTSGRPFSDWNLARAVIEQGVRIFEIKVNGYNQEIHEAVTGVKNSFWETISGISNIRSIRALDNKPFSAFIAIRISICKENYNILEEIVRFLVPLGIDKITLSFDDYDLSMLEAIPSIINTIETAIFNKIWIMTEKIPLCLLEGYEHHIYEIYLNFDDEFEHFDSCKNCVYYSTCKGVIKDYLSAQGADEFIAVSKSKHATDIGALKHA